MSPDEGFRAAEAYAILPSLVMSLAPCGESGLRTWVTYLFFESEATTALTVWALLPWAREVLDWRTIRLLPFACWGSFLSSRLVASWEPVPGRSTLSLSGRPAELAIRIRPTAITIQAAITQRALRAVNPPSLCSRALMRSASLHADRALSIAIIERIGR